MKIAEISKLTERLDDEGWEIEFKEDEREKEEFAEVLNDMHRSAGEDCDALREFFTFATIQKGSQGKIYEWGCKEFSEYFRTSFSGSGRGADTVIRGYFSDYGDDVLGPLIGDRYAKDYFDWKGYVEAHRPDLFLSQRGPITYLFEADE